ncbi:MAG: hypothetical protein VZR95_05300, partial [Alphaproteobacteria bacterium]
KAYLVSTKTYLQEFDRSVSVEIIKMGMLQSVYENLQFIIRTELKPENFYCRAVGETHSVFKTFLCIDKKDKDSVFLPTNKMKDVYTYE